ncbi:MAG: hypothetical protein JWM65_3759 [Sphingomonas bacterium]|nr:hypothetical protein [Sphingomonas bacterium]
MWSAPALAMVSIPAMVIAAPAADVAASPALVKSAREFADITVRMKVGDGHTDKVVFLGGAAEDLRVISIEVMPSTDNSEIAKPEAVAILRTRSQRVDHPTAGDRLFAEQRGVSIFIIGEWASPAPMWEIGRRNGAMAFRTVDKDGVAGVWQPWP